MVKIAFFTSCRGDMGILMPLIKKIYKTRNFESLLFVGGTHLSKKYGYTINEIKKQKLKITGTYNYVNDKDDPYELAKSTNKSGMQVARFFKKYDFDYVCILGDRYERIPIVLNCLIYKKPIVHLHGGEVTQGIIDEQIRHSISKAAHIHFVICDEYKQNLISLGEEKKRIHNVGSLAVDNILFQKKINYKSILKKYGLNVNKPFVIMTYHPQTLEFNISQEKQINNIMHSLKNYEYQVLITSPGIEVGSNNLLKLIKKQMDICLKGKSVFIESLGFSDLYNLIPYCEFVIGNSSFGIIEVPFFKKPTIDIGDRQKGRFRHKSVINSSHNQRSITNAIKKALSRKFRTSIKKMNFMFGKGNASNKIIEVLKKNKINQKLLQKPFLKVK